MSHYTTLISNASPSPEMSPSGCFSLTLTYSVSLEELDTLEDKIVLNCHELEVHEATIQATQTKTESTLTAKTISYDEKGRTVTLDFGQKILHDNRKSILSMKFDGILNNAMAGFYRSAYTDANGEKKFMFSTQCEVFPCQTRIKYRPVMLVELSLGRVFYVKTEYSFDEPALKATFASTLIIPSYMTALSNMPIQSEKPISDGKKKGKGPFGDDLKRVEFETTPIMSTYVNPLMWELTFIAPRLCNWRFRIY